MNSINKNQFMLLLLCFISISCIADKNEDSLIKAIQVSTESILNSVKDAPKYAADNTPNGSVVSYDATEYNYERFENSPCFNKLGFSPYLDQTIQEQMYKECESEYYKSLTIKILIVSVILLVIGYMVFISLKKKKDKK